MPRGDSLSTDNTAGFVLFVRFVFWKNTHTQKSVIIRVPLYHTHRSSRILFMNTLRRTSRVPPVTTTCSVAKYCIRVIKNADISQRSTMPQRSMWLRRPGLEMES